MIKGLEYNFGDKTLIIPPLTLGAVELFEEDFANFTNYTPVQQAKFVIKIVHEALKRNYPEITREEVAELIDFGNMAEVMNSVCNLSGLISNVNDGKGNSQGGK